MNKNSDTSFEDAEIDVQTTRKALVKTALVVATHVILPVALTVATNVVMNKMKQS